MSKLPSFQFYPGDWLRDQIAGCSWAAQGLWLRLLFIAHDGEPYGHLAINGKAIPAQNLARMCGGTLEEYTSLIAELERVGIPSYTADGVMYSRRMVQDAEKRVENAQRVSAHRERKRETIDKRKEIVRDLSHQCNVDVMDEKQKCNADVMPMSHPSSSSSSSSKTGREDRAREARRPAVAGEVLPPPDFAAQGPENGSVADSPGMAETVEYAVEIGLAEWKAIDWWRKMEAVGWRIKGENVRNWRVLVQLEMGYWVRDGSPAKPPAYAKEFAAKPIAAQRPKCLDSRQLTAKEKQILKREMAKAKKQL